MILATLSFLHACWWATGEFSLRAVLQGTQVGPGAASRCFFPRLPPSQPLFGAEGSGEPTLTVAAGDVVRLPCSSGVPTPRSTTWTKDGREVVAGGGPGQRLTLLPDGTLNIAEVTPGDEGSYLCSSTLQDNSTFWTQVRLLVTSDPENLTTSVAPGSALANGTLFVLRGSDVSFNCSTSSRSARRLAWTFGGAAASNGSLVSTVGASLDFRIAAVQPGPSGPLRLQVPGHRRSAGDVPDGHPECLWTPAWEPSHALFSCTWPGAYPTPTLRWAAGWGHEGRVYASEQTDSLPLMLNRSALSDGERLTCVARHATLAPGAERTCTLTIKPPLPKGEPLVMVQKGDSITLTCTEEESTPPANTTWRKGLLQEAVVPGFKYTLAEEGPVRRLTIHNVSGDDQGVYFCRSENLLGVRELEVYLTVRTSSAYTGVIIGVFVAAVIVASPIVFAKSLYSNRHRVCLGRTGGREGDGDVMNLVESDDEQIFQDAVPRLPPPNHGPQTTLVQIHRIPSSRLSARRPRGASHNQMLLWF
ncbi:unnamed protein product [Tetraodon nigroviridis]|uniref:(spotted green pufferfish) hypothetical protein n=1 Tax=Tetraodon nigroviridis TaxID=99883 RepID=Q4RTW9_TETNG|nr:unnamed protein product [Tetraodon nigroviridis]